METDKMKEGDRFLQQLREAAHTSDKWRRFRAFQKGMNRRICPHCGMNLALEREIFGINHDERFCGGR